ncbi:MAG: DNA internalization-related competence protein ComEC/Rec2 [Calditrichia bacterium]|nr:DNA internalization-related competence protein ComEC/Rec2 [Calditrichia bacterium]
MQYEKGNYFFFPKHENSSDFLKNGKKVNKILIIPPIKSKHKKIPKGFFKITILKTIPKRNPGFTSWKNIMLQNKAAVTGRLVDAVSVNDSTYYKNQENKFQTFIKNYTTAHYQKPLSGFVTAIVSGNRELLPWQLKKKFQFSGLSHLLAISGLHLGIYMIILVAIFNFYFINNFLRNLIITIILIFYLWAIDFVPSMSRAVIMGLCYLWAYYEGKIVHRFHPLLLSAIIILTIDPLQLFSLGFQFSFLAVAGILLFFPSLWKIIKKNKILSFFPVKFILASVFITFSAQILLFPFLVNYFHNFSILSFIANLFAIPITFLIIMLFIFSLLFSLIFPYISSLIDEMIHFLFFLLQYALGFFQNLGWGFISIPNFSPLMLFCYLLVFISLYYFITHPLKINFLYFFLVSVLTIVIFKNINKKSIYIFNIDQASAIFIKGEQNILIDSGKPKYNFNREYSIPFILQNLNVKKLDKIYISHLDFDHYGQTNTILKNWPDCKIYLPVTTLQFKKKTLNFLRHINNFKQINFISAGYSDSIGKDYHLLCFAPAMFSPPSSLNATSLVLKIFSPEQSILFCGDIDIKQLQNIIIFENTLKSDVLVFPHHGSKTGFYPPFMKIVSPELTVFSCGWNNIYHHPAKEVLQYLEKEKMVFKRTDINGCVEID